MERLKELLEQLRLHFQVEMAMADILDGQDKRISLLEGLKLKYDAKFNSLDKRYSELLMVVKDINRKLPMK